MTGLRLLTASGTGRSGKTAQERRPTLRRRQIASERRRSAGSREGGRRSAGGRRIASERRRRPGSGRRPRLRGRRTPGPATRGGATAAQGRRPRPNGKGSRKTLTVSARNSMLSAASRNPSERTRTMANPKSADRVSVNVPKSGRETTGEGRKVPTWSSRSHRGRPIARTRQTKWKLYRDVLKVPEYFQFDPTEDYLKPPCRDSAW